MASAKLSLIVALVGIPSLVAAQPGAQAPTPVPGAALLAPAGQPTVKRYGWTIALLDLGSVVGAGVFESPGFYMGGYLLGGPIVHVAHGNGGKALASLGLRVGLPFLGGIIGANAEDCSNGGSLCGLGGMVLGGATGMATAMLVDWFVLAKDVTHQGGPLPPPGIRVGGAHVLPNIAVSRSGSASLGLTGIF